MERGVVNGKMMNPISDISGLKKMWDIQVAIFNRQLD
jgi:hypothetical protein